MPQRIRAGCDCTCGGLSIEIRSLPQRIRAGCDSAAVGAALFTSFFATAHSRGLRRCWKPSLTATRFFATAHSRGLRRSKTKSSTTLCCFATAHSRGLRPSWRNNPIPSRLLCHSAFARVATVVYCVCCRYCAIFATAHSRGLRPAAVGAELFTGFFATAHSRGLRPSAAPCVCTLGNLCHSAFARVATAEKQCSALRICCEKVDSFSSVGESGLALTIFPFSFAAKATYVAINDSFGRAIDRFFGANRTGISVNYDFAEHPCL